MNSIERITQARNAILDDLKRRYQAGDQGVKLNPRSQGFENGGEPKNYFSGAGEMPCPICGVGRLMYSRASYNGHVHARCTTQGCVAWME